MGAPITPSLGRRLGAVEFANIQHTPPKHVACLPPLSNTGLRLHPGFLCGIYFHKSMTFIEILFRFAPTVGRGRRLQSNPMMEIVQGLFATAPTNGVPSPLRGLNRALEWGVGKEKLPEESMIERVHASPRRHTPFALRNWWQSIWNVCCRIKQIQWCRYVQYHF